VDEAKALIEVQDFDLVVADMHMTGSAGHLGLQAWLKANKPSLAQRLVFMCASAPTLPTNEDLRSGFPILQKPFKTADLLATVEAALGDIHSAPIGR
jgi:DNA-binding response OmpR family regulator